MSDDFRLVVWGARGSHQVCDARMQRYGGDTSCFEIRAGNHSLMIDGGSGANAFEDDLLERGVSDLDLLLTHSHLDHMIGLPFFVPCYMANHDVRIHVGHLDHGVRGDKPFEALFDPLLFPVPVKTLKAVRIQRFYAPDTKQLGPFEVASIHLNHPGNAIGYKVSAKGRSIAVITDHEHGDEERDQAVIDFCAGVDILLIDAMYSDQEYEKRVGWGHATQHAAIEIAKAAKVRQLVLSHHAPWRTDAQIDDMLDSLRADFPKIHAAEVGASYQVD